MTQSKARLPAALEALLASLACHFGAGLAKAAVLAIDEAARGGGGAPPAIAIGAAQALAPALLLLLLYGRRLEGLAAAPARALSALCAAPRRAAPLLLLLLHSAQFAASAAAAAPRPLRCASLATVVWGPIFEELCYRVVVFYVALHRSGGDLPFAALTSAALFAAVHLANVAAAGARAPGSALAWMQVAAAAGFGGTFSLLFAASGSVVEVALLHIANNAAAVAFWAREVESGASLDCEAAAAPPSVPPALLASLAVQVAAYAWASSDAWHECVRLANGDGRALRSMHALMFAPGGQEAVKKTD